MTYRWSLYGMFCSIAIRRLQFWIKSWQNHLKLNIRSVRYAKYQI